MVPQYVLEGMERAKILAVFEIRHKQMSYVNSRVAKSSLSVQRYMCLKTRY